MKKIVLKKDTLRTLDDRKLAAVIGGENEWKTMKSDISCRKICWPHTH